MSALQRAVSRIVCTVLPAVILLIAARAGAQANKADVNIVVHGGAGSPVSQSGDLVPAVEAAWSALEGGASALDAAVAAVVVLEDNPRFNAGTGGNIRLDGETVQMDAAVMNERGDFGAVSVIQRVKNPVRVAKGVLETPHLLLSGDGATRFARTLGYPDYDPKTPESRRRYERLRKRMRDDALGGEFEGFDWKRHWNFPSPLARVLEPSDTVGAAVHDGRGGFGVAISTGGTSVTLYGRVGDVPIYGAGSYAGEAGAACATGWGEYIIRERLSQRVHEWIADGMSAKSAVEKGIALFPEHIGVGLIAVSPDGIGAYSNRNMAWAGMTKGRLERADDGD